MGSLRPMGFAVDVTRGVDSYAHPVLLEYQRRHVGDQEKEDQSRKPFLSFPSFFASFFLPSAKYSAHPNGFCYLTLVQVLTEMIQDLSLVNRLAELYPISDYPNKTFIAIQLPPNLVQFAGVVQRGQSRFWAHSSDAHFAPHQHHLPTRSRPNFSCPHMPQRAPTPYQKPPRPNIPALAKGRLARMGRIQAIVYYSTAGSGPLDLRMVAELEISKHTALNYGGVLLEYDALVRKRWARGSQFVAAKLIAPRMDPNPLPPLFRTSSPKRRKMPDAPNPSTCWAGESKGVTTNPSPWEVAYLTIWFGRKRLFRRNIISRLLFRLRLVSDPEHALS